MSERRAIQMLADEVVRAVSGRMTRSRLNNAIAIWQTVARRAMKAGEG